MSWDYVRRLHAHHGRAPPALVGPGDRKKNASLRLESPPGNGTVSLVQWRKFARISRGIRSVLIRTGKSKGRGKGKS
jgi:hypothetical protein